MIRKRVANIRGQAAALAKPLKQAQLSPLAGMILAFLLAMTLGAGLFAAYAIFGPDGSDTEVAAPDWRPPTLSVGELDPPKSPSADVEALSRPIFSKSRRPLPPLAQKSQINADVSPNAVAPGGLTVSAIVKDKKMNRAYLFSLETPEGTWMKAGDTIDSWIISRIDPGEVILKSGKQTTSIKLYPDPPPANADPGNGL